MRSKIVIALALVVIYILLCATFLFGSAFMVTWGEKKSWYLKVIMFAQDFPMRIVNNNEVNLNLILINALFWTLLIGILLYLIDRFIVIIKG